MTIALSRHVRLATLTLLVSTVAGAQQRVEETFFVPVPERINFLAPDPLRPVAIGAAADGSVVSLGSASASGLPAVNAVQPDRAGEDCLFAGRLFPCLDLYLVRVLPDGQGPAYMTYLGGPNQEQAQDLAVAPDGTAYILATGGLDWLDPSVDLSEPGSVPSESDAFILRVSPSGAPEALIRLPRAPERYSSIDLDSAGAVYLAGTVHSGIEPINGFGNEKFELTLYRSKDGGDVWDAKPTEAPPLADHLLAVDADGLTQLWTYGREGVFFSHDLGRKWDAVRSARRAHAERFRGRSRRDPDRLSLRSVRSDVPLHRRSFRAPLSRVRDCGVGRGAIARSRGYERRSTNQSRRGADVVLAPFPDRLLPGQQSHLAAPFTARSFLPAGVRLGLVSHGLARFL